MTTLLIKFFFASELKRYPTVVLDMSTYPYFPSLPDDNAMDQTSLDGRKRLASYSQSASSGQNNVLSVSQNESKLEKEQHQQLFQSNQSHQQQQQQQQVVFDKQQVASSDKPKIVSSDKNQPVSSEKPNAVPTSEKQQTLTCEKQQMGSSEKQGMNSEKQTMLPSDKHQVTSEKPKQASKEEKENQTNSKSAVNNAPPATSSQPSSPQLPSSVQSQPPKSVSPIHTPSTASTPPMATSPTTSQASGVKSPSLMSPQSEPVLSPPQATHTKGPEKRSASSSSSKDDAPQQTKGGAPGADPGASFSRTDVKQTLKSMGLRCEDFTISVYSREQAHAILRKQGVEVTNHQPPKQQQTASQSAPQHSPSTQLHREQPPKTPPQHQSQSQPPGQPQPNLPSKAGVSKGKPTSNSNPRPSVSVMRSEPARPQPQPQPPPSKVDEDDDDDDCVILDPPEGPKPPPPPPRRFPQQFQLMGTTVQVNRGSKRQMRSMSHAPMPKRVHSSRPYYYNESYQYEESPEASVQDTLKRLKNYNISITCRRNSAQRSPRVNTMDSDSSDLEHDGSHLDSEDEEDMAKYLECEIDEEKELGSMDAEGEEMLDLDSSGSLNEGSPERLEKGMARRDKRKFDELDDDERLNSTVEIDDDEKENEEMNFGVDEQDNDEREEDEEEENEREMQDEAPKSSDELEKDPSANISDWGGGGDDENATEASDDDKIQTARGKPADSPVEHDLSGKPAKSPDDESINKKFRSDASAVEGRTQKEKLPQESSGAGALSSVGSSSESKANEGPQTTKLPGPLESFQRMKPNQEEKTPLEEENFEAQEDPVGRDMVDNLDDDINEELEKQLLEAGNLDDDDFEGEDIEGEGLDNLDLENEL